MAFYNTHVEERVNCQRGNDMNNTDNIKTSIHTAGIGFVTLLYAIFVLYVYSNTSLHERLNRDIKLQLYCGYIIHLFSTNLGGKHWCNLQTRFYNKCLDNILARCSWWIAGFMWLLLLFFLTKFENQQIKIKQEATILMMKAKIHLYSTCQMHI